MPCGLRRLSLAGCLAALVVVTGCHHQRQVVSAPPPPPPPVDTIRQAAPPLASNPPAAPPAQPLSDSADAEYVAAHDPIYTETGRASWYGPPYHNRRGANGQIYDQNAFSAAHRTLPMNSLIKVTNVSTGQSAVMRITDRGPFVPDRVLDLSLASAKAVGVWRPGTAMVRVDVYSVPSSIEQGGRWCVQIGAFRSGNEALDLRDHLSRKYQTASVIEFTGPTGHWVRIRPLHDDRERAVEIARELKPKEGEAYLVRLD